MRNDLCISAINDVFSLSTDRWDRPFTRSRTYDGAVLFTEGEIEYNFEGTLLTARAGDLLLLPGNLPYSGRKLSHHVRFYVIDFTSDSPTAFAAFGAPAVITLSRFEEVHSEFFNALQTWESHTVERQLQIKSFLYSILCNVFLQEERNTTSAAISDVLSYMRENLHDPALTVTHLCQRFFISESQLRRNVHKATGLNPNEYLLTLRLHRAKNDLLFTHKSVQQIARECGFASPYYFTRRFTAFFGLSPTDFRKQRIPSI